MRDCCFLVADQAMRTAFELILDRGDRSELLGTGGFEFDPAPDVDLIQVAGYTDGGVHKHAARLLAPKLETHRHAVVCLDKKFPGAPAAGRIRRDITGNLRTAGWDPSRFEVIVIQPELERWLWLDHPACERAFGYPRADHGRSMRVMMREQGQWHEHDDKPHDCDAALVWAARWKQRKTAPATLFKAMLPTAPVQHCEDPAFVKLRDTLKSWFPSE